MDIFKIDNKITTNGMNCFKIIGVNESDISCIDLLTDDFHIFNKKAYNFTLFDYKKSLVSSLSEILDDLDIDNTIKNDIFDNMEKRINKWF